MKFNKIQNFFTHLKLAAVSLLLAISLFGSLNIGALAFDVCVVPASKPTFLNIASITDASHYPIIPSGCKGAISPASLPGIFTRAYGFISSLGLNLLFFYIIFSGFTWIYGGLDGGKDVAKAKKNLESAVTGFAIILLAYIIVNTFVSVFVAGGTIPTIDSFFNSKIN
jgi:hypothetical protein